MKRYRLKILPVDVGAEPPTAGWRFFFFMGIVLVAAINTGNNLMYLVLATLFGAFIVSWTLAGMSLRGLEARVALPLEIFAGEESLIDFTIARNRAGASRALSLALSGSGEPQGHVPYLENLAGGDRTKLQGLVRYPERGHHELRGVRVSTTYPFGLLRRRRLHADRRELWIYPAIMPIEEILRLGGGERSAVDALRRGRDGGLINLRPFMPGDDRRLLHWKASAKTGALMVKELSREEDTTVLIHFNHFSAGPPDKDTDKLFETGVSLAASLAYHGRADGLTMVFSAPGLRLSPESGETHIAGFLRYLAAVRPEGRLLGHPSRPFAERRFNELVIVIDPLNRGLDWGGDCQVFDQPLVERLAEVRQ